jgi:excisionase family DNA binding protein
MPPNVFIPNPDRLSGEQSVAPSGDVTTRLLTAVQLAERWQVPPSQVYRLARDGRVPVVSVGRYYRFRLDAIERWELESERVG